MIAFLVRHFNDIDHIVPIVYKMLEEKETPVKVFCMNPFLYFRDDFRLNFLKERFGCRTKYIYQAYTPTFIHHLFCFLVCWLPHRKLPARLEWISRIARLVALRLMGTKTSGRVIQPSAWCGRLFDASWAKRFLQRHQVSCLVIDLGDVARFIYQPLSEAAEKLGIPRIGVPHGIDIIANDDFHIKFVDQQRRAELGAKYCWLDKVIVQADAIKEKYVRNGLPAEKIAVLGSTRFCNEWMEIYHRILPPQPLPPSDGKLKVVYMDHDKAYRLNTEEIVKSLEAVTKMDFVKLVIKKSTRMPLSDDRLKDCGHVDSTTSSVYLIQWADVVLSTISSIVFEVYHQGKLFIYPKYFTENEMLFEQFEACWAVSNIGELLSAMRAIYDGSYEIPYTDDNVRAFQSEVVYGGNPGADVLAGYTEAILGHSRRIL